MSEPLFIQYQVASGAIAFGKGEVTKEMIAECPEGTLLIQVADNAIIITDREIKDEYPVGWLVVYRDGNGKQAAIFSSHEFLVDALHEGVPVSSAYVQWAQAIYERDFNGTPYFVR